MTGLPNALVIGPMKAGTSWIHAYMESRGDIGLPTKVKETFFFDCYWHKGHQWYTRQFEHSDPRISATRLEVGSSYFHHPDVPSRVRDTLGDIPLVVTLRDPVERAWSHYLHLRRYGYTKAPLRQAVLKYPEIVAASRYNTHLQRWYAACSKASIHFVWHDLLAAAPEAYAAAVCRGVGIEFRPVKETLRGRHNQAAIPSSHFLAAAGDRTAHVLRRLGFYGAVNAAKRAGLKRVFFGKPGSAAGMKPTADEREWLSAQLTGEIPLEAEAARNRAGLVPVMAGL